MAEIRNIKLVLEYDGSHYHGWQRQLSDRTIQGVLEEALQTMTQEPVTVLGSGRTDAGVHALHQVCHFRTHSRLTPESFLRGLNSLIPDDIRVKAACEAPSDFHARYSARAKTYEYRILNTRDPDVFLRTTTWHIPMPLNREEMARCLELLRGTHDFSAFRSSGSNNRDPVRNLFRAELHSREKGLLVVCLEADGFLRHMVRNIVGTLVSAGQGKIDTNHFHQILKSGDRRKAGIKAPAQGLFLTMVKYKKYKE